MEAIRTSFVLIAFFMFCFFVAHAADTASITDKSDDGVYLGLDDGTKWIVSPPDRSTASSWTVGDDVVIVENTKNCSEVEIIDTDESGDEVCAKKIPD
jgi:hypothetical protein